MFSHYSMTVNYIRAGELLSDFVAAADLVTAAFDTAHKYIYTS